MTSFEEYTEQFGCHFNKKLYEWALSQLKDRNGNDIVRMTKDQAIDFLRTNGIEIINGHGHDIPYVLALCRAKCYGSSVEDDRHLALLVKDYLDDREGSPTKAFDHFVIDCHMMGRNIFWDEMI